MDAPPPAPAPSKRRARTFLAAKLLVTAAVLVYALSRLKLDEVLGAARRLTAQAFLIAMALTFANLALAAVRWRVLLAAFGAKDPPGLAFLARAQLVGHFYNTFVPGNVTGDGVRAHATRGSFDTPLGSYMVVGIERFFGLAGLFTVGALGVLLHPLVGVSAGWLAVLASMTAIAIALIPVLGRSIGGRFPGRIGKWASGLPVATRPALLGVAMLLSVFTHTIVGLTGHVLVDAIAPRITASESIALVPLAMGSTYIPSFMGLGVREGAFQELLGRIGISHADATAGSLSVLAVYSVVAAVGGLLHLLRPLRVDPAPEHSPAPDRAPAGQEPAS